MKCIIKSQCHGITHYLPSQMQKTVIYFEVNIGLLGPHEYWLVILGLRTFTVLERCDYFVLLLLHKKILVL